MADVSNKLYRKAMLKLMAEDPKSVVDNVHTYDIISAVFHEQILKIARKSKEHR